MKNLIIFIGVIAGGFGIYKWIDKKKSLVQQISLDIKNANIHPGLGSTEIDFDIAITNPSTGNEVIHSFTFDVVYNNVSIGKINYLQDIVIEPKSTKNMTVPCIINNLDLIKNAPALISSSFNGVKLILDGFINTDLGAIPFTKTTTLS